MEAESSTRPNDTKALLASASVEVSSRGHDFGDLTEAFAPGTDVTITFLPGDDYHHNIDTATRLRRIGYNPVPHIAARGLPSPAALGDFLTRVRGEADVNRILLVAGDIAVPRGPFSSTLDVCRSGLIEGHGIDRVTIAGHPEGHPQTEPDTTYSAIAARRDWARGAGIALDMITQFCFASGPILDLMSALEQRGLDLPVTIGLAGPATPATLAKFALRCGIGSSIKAVRDKIGRFGRLLVEAGPDEVVRGIAEAPPEATAHLAGFHFYPLGGLRNTGRWIKANTLGRSSQMASNGGRASRPTPS